MPFRIVSFNLRALLSERRSLCTVVAWVNQIVCLGAAWGVFRRCLKTDSTRRDRVHAFKVEGACRLVGELGQIPSLRLLSPLASEARDLDCSVPKQSLV